MHGRDCIRQCMESAVSIGYSGSLPSKTSNRRPRTSYPGMHDHHTFALEQSSHTWCSTVYLFSGTELAILLLLSVVVGQSFCLDARQLPYADTLVSPSGVSWPVYYSLPVPGDSGTFSSLAPDIVSGSCGSR